MQRVLVTGGAGFIGSHVTAALVDAGHEVRVLDAWHPAAHGAGGARPDEVHGAPVTVADLRDPESVERAVRHIDVVVHQAAMVGMGLDLADLPDYVGSNDLGTAVLLAAMAQAGIRRLVLASSMVVYGEGSYRCPSHGSVQPAPRAETDLAVGRFDPLCPHCGAALEPTPVGEDAPMLPRSVYAATKVAQEHLSLAWALASGGSVIALRYHNVYGPGMPRDTPYSGVAAIFRSALAAGQAPRVFEDGRQVRDFVHVHDVAEANRAAVDALGASGMRCYNVASGAPATVGDMAVALARACGGPEPVITGEYRGGDVRHVFASPDRAERELGFQARIGLREGITGFATAPLRG